MTEANTRNLMLTSQIAGAYLAANSIDATAVPGLIRDIQRTLTDLELSGVLRSSMPRAASS